MKGVPHFLAPAVHGLGGIVGDGKLRLQLVGAEQRHGADDAKVTRLTHGGLQKRKTPGRSRRPGAERTSETRISMRSTSGARFGRASKSRIRGSSGWEARR